MTQGSGFSYPAEYPFKIMGEQKVIPASVCFARPPFEGPGTKPPF